MKNTFVFLLFLLLFGYSQAQQCSTIYFNYGLTGHRTQRLFETCDPLVHFKNDTTSTSNRNFSSFIANIFPNPVTDIFTIELPKLVSDIENINVASSVVKICDFTGKEIYSITTKLDKLQINMSEFSSGIYFLTVARGNQRSAQTVIKN